MIELRRGNILEVEAEALVNTVNCVGVMGKGIALQFKNKYPQNFKFYERACKDGDVQLGRMTVFATGSFVGPKYIINFPTKHHWKSRSRIRDIESGLRDLIAHVKRLGITSLALPPLGCGNGGLHWKDVRPIIERALGAIPSVRILLYEPAGSPAAEQMAVATERPRMTLARASIFKLIQQYGVPDYRLQMLEVQKLAYFLQRAGQDLQLNFAKERYGPYAENLNFLLQRMEGHFIRGYGDRSRDARIHVLPHATIKADTFLSDHSRTIDGIKRVHELVQGFETPYGMELLASVCWVANEQVLPTLDAGATVVAVHEWSARKRRLFKPEHIRIAWKQLAAYNWIPAA